MYKPYHVPHASRITTSGTIFTEICFGVSKEWVRSWSQVFLITKVKTFAKKFLGVRPVKVTRRKKKKEKKKIAIAKLFALNANAKTRMAIANFFCGKRKLKKLNIFLDQKSIVLYSLLLLYAKFRTIEIYWN